MAEPSSSSEVPVEAASSASSELAGAPTAAAPPATIPPTSAATPAPAPTPTDGKSGARAASPSSPLRSTSPSASTAAAASDRPPHKRGKWDYLEVPTTDAEGNVLSSSQRRRLRKDLIYAAQKEIRRAKRKEERVRRRENRRERIARGETLPPNSTRRLNHMADADAWPHRVCLDLDFIPFMEDKDLHKVVKQVGRCYARNRRTQHALQLHLTKLCPPLSDMLASANINAWDIHRHTEDYTDVFAHDDIVYLTSESPNTLTTLDPAKVYIVGGLVDHNRHKGLTAKRAAERNVATAKLPIANYVHLASREVLTINHVFEILLAFLETRSWREAFFRIIPERKGLSEPKRAGDTDTGKEWERQDEEEEEEKEEEEEEGGQASENGSAGGSDDDDGGDPTKGDQQGGAGAGEEADNGQHASESSEAAVAEGKAAVAEETT